MSFWTVESISYWNPKAENTGLPPLGEREGGFAKGKGVYGRYHSVTSNLASLNLCTEDNSN